MASPRRASWSAAGWRTPPRCSTTARVATIPLSASCRRQLADSGIVATLAVVEHLGGVLHPAALHEARLGDAIELDVEVEVAVRINSRGARSLFHGISSV